MTGPVICPTIMGQNKSAFLDKIRQFSVFAPRIHIDLSDGQFAKPKLLTIPEVVWPPATVIDFHLMYQNPVDFLEEIIVKEPHMVIFHIEANDWIRCAEVVRSHGIKAGIALLADTPVKDILPHLASLDHVLVFSGKLGSFGGKVNFQYLEKVAAIKNARSDIEVGWDGGVNDTNARRLADGGVDVLNTGGFINNAPNPDEAYAILKQEVTRNDTIRT